MKVPQFPPSHLKEKIMKTRYLQTLLILALPALALLFPLGAVAADKNTHAVDISDVTQVGTAQLKPGPYKVEWQGTGPAVQVTFQQSGKTVVTVPATLKTNDAQVTQDATLTEAGGSNTVVLKEIDFAHQKEALVFGQ
jgi:hypothetical protein